MKAIEIIDEAVNPKQIFLQRHGVKATGPVSFVKMANRLWPSMGWRHLTGMLGQPEGRYGFEIEKAGTLWRVYSTPPGAEIELWRRPWSRPTDPWEHSETVKLGSMQSLVTHLKIFGLPLREAVNPKQILRDLPKKIPIPSVQELDRILRIWGWQWEAIDGGPDGFWFVERAPPNRDWTRYQLRLSPQHGAGLSIYRLNAENRWVGIERLYYDDRDELFDRLRRLRLVIEAVNPKQVLKQIGSSFRYNDDRGNVRISDVTGSFITYSIHFSGSPVLTHLRYTNKVPYEGRAAAGKRLMKAACDFALKVKGQPRVRVMLGTTAYQDETGFWRSVELDDPAEIGRLYDPKTRTTASGFVHFLNLESVTENVMDLDPATGQLRYDPSRPKAPHSIWTYQRTDPEGNPQPYIRNVRLYSGKPMEIIAAYRKDKAPLELLKAVKLYGPEVAKAAKRAADHIAWALKARAPIDLVMPVPSSKPLARRFARLLANQTGAELADPITKTKAMKGIPIMRRLSAARGAFAVAGRYRGKTIVLVDDYIVTASSMIAAASELYQAGARRVIGAALAV